MQVVVIGNGIAGITAALGVRRRQPQWSITVVSGESDHFFSRTALMYIYMGQLRYADTKPYEDWFWEANRIALVRAWVEEIDLGNQRLRLDRGEPLAFDELVVATGSHHNTFGWPGQDLDGVQGLITLMDLDALEGHSVGLERAVIVGGGLIGIELAEMLRSRGFAVTMLVREPAYWNNVMPDEEARLIGRAIRHEGVDLRLGTELAEILPDPGGRVRAVRTADGEEIACQLVGLTAGVRPNLDLVAGGPIDTGRGVRVDLSFRTSHPHVFAAGDCAEILAPGEERGRVEPLWYTGKKHGEVVGRVVAGEEATYDPGVAFNSAKFFDLEWHTYGRVPNAGGDPSGALQSLYWEHPNQRHAIRLVHDGGVLVGVNTLGVRYRHRVCERWIAEARPVADLLDRLGEANFDREFARRFERDAAAAFREQLS